MLPIVENDKHKLMETLDSMGGSWRRIKYQYKELCESWESFAAGPLKHLMKGTYNDELLRFTGEALSVPFQVQMQPYLSGKLPCGYITVKVPSGKDDSQKTVASFLIAANGKFLDTEGSELTAWNEEFESQYYALSQVLLIIFSTAPDA